MNKNINSINDVVVIGAGIVGLSVALKLKTEGYSVAIVDKDDPMQGCSAGNAGFLSEANIFPPATSDIILKLPKLLFAKEGPLVIAPTYLNRMVPWTIKAAATLNRAKYNAIVEAFSSLITRSQASLIKLATIADAQHFLSKEGGLVCFLTREAFEARKEKIPFWRSKGIVVRVLDNAETRKLEPNVTDNIVGSIFFENSGRCKNPQGLGLQYFNYLQEQGVPFYKSSVLKVSRKGVDCWVVKTSVKEVEARKVIFCAGYYTETLLKSFGYSQRVASERGYHLMLPAPEVVLNRPVVFGEPYFAATPMEHGLRLAGTAEFTHPNKPANTARALMLKDLAVRYLPQLNAEQAVPWMGVRPTLPDGLPAIGSVKNQPGLFYAYGHGHNGLMTSAITAECIAALVANKTPPVDIIPFDVLRFG